MADRQTTIDEFIHTEMGNQHIPGLSIALVQNNQPLLQKGYGLTNVELNAPATAETIYEIASITKPFTATAILQLVEQGQLALDERIAAYLPDLPDAWAEITIRHILAHQSGIKSYTAVDEYWQSTRLDISREEILQLVADLPLDFPPGSRHAYDNTGYYLLGLLIEQVTGESYGDFLSRSIFQPLGMTTTRINNPYAIVPQRAAGYSYQEGNLRNKEYYSPAGTFSAGVLLSSVADLSKWIASFYSDTLLSATSRKLMWTPHPSEAKNEREFNFTMGLGWFLVDHNNKHFIGHNGSIVGFSSSFSHFPADKLSVILLCNMADVENPHILAHRVAEFYK